MLARTMNGDSFAGLSSLSSSVKHDTSVAHLNQPARELKDHEIVMAGFEFIFRCLRRTGTDVILLGFVRLFPFLTF